MSKTTFNLQTPQFSDSDNETPIDSLLKTYDKEYSLIYQEIKSFLKECKDNINKYIQLNQFGARFNMFALYAQMTNIETSTLNGLSDVSKQQLEHQKGLKVKYEKEFQGILERMEGVIREFMRFEVEFKREYFGWNVSQQQAEVASSVKHVPNPIAKFKSPILGTRLSSEHSIKSGSSISNNHSSSNNPLRSHSRPLSITLPQDQTKEKELQQKLRQILKRKLAPQKQNLIKFCDKESDPYKNMMKLQQKIDMMQSEMILSKTREEKIIDIFNKRRVENIQPKGGEVVHCELIETDAGEGSKDGDRKMLVGCKSKSKIGDGNESQLLVNGSSGHSQKKVNKPFSKPSIDPEPRKNNSFHPTTKNLLCDPLSQSKIHLPANQSSTTPRKLISPKGLPKSPSSHMIQSSSNSTNLTTSSTTNNFFSSPKNLLSKKLPTSRSPPTLQMDFTYKKGRQKAVFLQDLQPQDHLTTILPSQHSFHSKKRVQFTTDSSPLYHSQNLQENQDGVDGGMGLIHSSSNGNKGKASSNNREQFLLMRRKSNNNSNQQGFCAGGRGLIE